MKKSFKFACGIAFKDCIGNLDPNINKGENVHSTAQGARKCIVHNLLRSGHTKTSDPTLFKATNGELVYVPRS